MKPRKTTGDVGGNRPRGSVTGLGGPGEGGGPAGVQRSGGRKENHPRAGTGAPLGTTPTDLQQSPEEIVEDWQDDWK
jgi:hypothetical protein